MSAADLVANERLLSALFGWTAAEAIGGELVGIIGVTVDLTDQHARVQAVRAQQRRYRRAFDQTIEALRLARTGQLSDLVPLPPERDGDG